MHSKISDIVPIPRNFIGLEDVDTIEAILVYDWESRENEQAKRPKKVFLFKI
jgi:hypothetical protein